MTPTGTIKNFFYKKQVLVKWQGQNSACVDANHQLLSKQLQVVTVLAFASGTQIQIHEYQVKLTISKPSKLQ